ncbi:hypothetical protein F5884DRAFT_424600 [Xylogone sp. PMI_703]|nr:hypothetical protein F5884DRAFT_424600 [Xylogone sp. PMI_703]
MNWTSILITIAMAYYLTINTSISGYPLHCPDLNRNTLLSQRPSLSLAKTQEKAEIRTESYALVSSILRKLGVINDARPNEEKVFNQAEYQDNKINTPMGAESRCLDSLFNGVKLKELPEAIQCVLVSGLIAIGTWLYGY